MSELKRPEDFYIRSLFLSVKIKDIMVEKVISLDVEDPFSRVEEIFRQHHIRHLPIVEGQKNLVGIITQRDLYRISAPRIDEERNLVYDKDILDSYILKNVMTKNPLTLGPHNPIADALLIMVDKKYGAIPIVEKDNRLIGIITQIDILRMGARIIREVPN